MDPAGATTASADPSALLVATETRLRARQRELEPLLDEHDRVHELIEILERTPSSQPAGGSERPAHPAYSELVGELDGIRSRLRNWSAKLAPLVREHEQIAHILAAFETASTMSAEGALGRRRRRSPRASANGGASAARRARADQLKALLEEPRSRAEIAERLQLSASRVTELLEPLLRAGEVTEIRDPERPSRKLWALAAATASAPGGGDIAGGQ